MHHIRVEKAAICMKRSSGFIRFVNCEVGVVRIGAAGNPNKILGNSGPATPFAYTMKYTIKVLELSLCSS